VPYFYGLDTILSSPLESTPVDTQPLTFDCSLEATVDVQTPNTTVHVDLSRSLVTTCNRGYVNKQEREISGLSGLVGQPPSSVGRRTFNGIADTRVDSEGNASLFFNSSECSFGYDDSRDTGHFIRAAAGGGRIGIDGRTNNVEESREDCKVFHLKIRADLDIDQIEMD